MPRPKKVPQQRCYCYRLNSDVFYRVCPSCRHQRDDRSTVRCLLHESRNWLDEVFYYGRWESILDLRPEASQIGTPPGLGDQTTWHKRCELKDETNINTSMAGTQGESQEESYFDLLMDHLQQPLITMIAVRKEI
eukprot:715067-Amphidinium_carterae.1